MTDYESLLNTPEWQKKRAEIITRDKGRCMQCGKSGLPIEVHHIYYKANTQPWEYDNDALMSVCHSCHKHIHQTREIPFLDSNGNLARSCDRCNGNGYIPEYNHIASGICFKCHGAGVCTTGFAWQLSAFTRYNTENLDTKSQEHTYDVTLPEYTEGSIHVNAKGPYIIEALQNSHAYIRYADGKKTSLRLTMLERIERDMLSHRKILNEREALDYAQKHNLKLQSEDPLMIYHAVYTHYNKRLRL